MNNSNNYEETALKILENIGGSNNVKSISYCMTRLRVSVKDKNKVDVNALEKIKDVMRVVLLGNQYQIVVGGISNELYEEIVVNRDSMINKEGKINEVIESDMDLINKKENNENTSYSLQTILGSLIETLSSIVSPIIPAMLASGFIKTLAMLMITVFGVSEASTTYQLFNVLGDTIYAFFPILIGWSAANRFNANIGVSIVLTGFLINPAFAEIFVNSENVALLNIPVTDVYYGSSVLPAILSVWLLAFLEKRIRKLLPQSLRSIFVPFLSLLIIFPILITVIGPIGVWGGELFASLFTSLYDFSPAVAGAVIGGMWQVLIIVGMHIAILGMVSGPNIARFGRDQVIMTHAPSLISQIAAGLAVSVKAKNPKLKREALALSFSSFIAGSVIEPVMYGVNLKLKRPFIAVLIGGAIGGAITGAAGAGTTAAVALSLYTFPAYLGNGFGGLMLGCIVAFIVTFGLTYAFGFDEELYEKI